MATGLKRRLRELTGHAALLADIEHLNARIDQLEHQLHESREESWERSRERWRAAKPTASLTWDAEISGRDFVAKAEQYGVYGPDKHVVEIGPGYGRLLRSALEDGAEFRRYTGVDLSEDNVAHLREQFPQQNVDFTVADAETVELPEPADAVVSSLTFKHMFPSFEVALGNLASQLNPGGVVLIDLIEGRRRYFEDDNVTYIRWYEQSEITEILGRVGLELIDFDEVQHHPELKRLLVATRRTA